MTEPPGLPTRLVVVQGPLQALVACAAVRHAERRWRRRARNVMLFGGVLADDSSPHYAVVRGAALDCARALEWERILELADVPRPRLLRDALTPHGPVAEVLCSRNWQEVNEVALAAFPEARRVVVGDGLGVIDADRDPGRPQFELALPVIPQPLRSDSLDGTDIDVVPRETLSEVIALTRERSAHLRLVDEELAGFARGGTLLLINYLTEAYDSTLRGEIDLAHRVVRAAGPPPGSPIVIKPHPRSSLGQAAALGRRLRIEGHEVRIMGWRECGHYPIELFEGLLHAVYQVLAQGSSSALSIAYLHGIRPAVDLPPGAARQLLPRQRRCLLGAPVQLTRTLDRLAQWDGRSPLPPPSDWSPSRGDRIRGRLVRPIMWAPASDWRRRLRSWELPPVPASIQTMLCDPRPQVVVDEASMVAWLLHRSDAGVVDPERLIRAPGPPGERILAALEELSGGPETPFALMVAVTPSTHAPGWLRGWRSLAGIKLIEGASLSAEQCEELLEGRTDILLRVPEIGCARGLRRSPPRPERLPPGYVAFACRTRGASSSRVGADSGPPMTVERTDRLDLAQARSDRDLGRSF